MAINRMQGVPEYWRSSLTSKRRAYFTSKDAATRFRSICNNYIISAPLTDDWYGAWVVFYY